MNFSQIKAIIPKLIGNGKTHRTPLPRGLKKIRIISFKAFLNLKGLFKHFKRPDAIKPQRYHKKLTLTNNRPAIAIQDHATGTYEPSRINDAFNSLFWQWRRVSEWHRYINDPYENINGHMYCRRIQGEKSPTPKPES